MWFLREFRWCTFEIKVSKKASVPSRSNSLEYELFMETSEHFLWTSIVLVHVKIKTSISLKIDMASVMYGSNSTLTH